MPNDWDNLIPEDSANRMTAAQIDKHLRTLGCYSHMISFVNADGNPRFIRCHAHHVAEHMQKLVEYANKGQCSELNVQEI